MLFERTIINSGWKKVSFTTRIKIFSFAVFTTFSIMANSAFAQSCYSEAMSECNDPQIRNGYASDQQCYQSQLKFCQEDPDRTRVLPVVKVKADPIDNWINWDYAPWVLPNLLENNYSLGGGNNDQGPTPNPKDEKGTPRDETCLPVQIASGQKMLHETIILV